MSAEAADNFLSDDTGVTQLLDLIKRTDDPPLRWEGTRVFANALRSLKGTYSPNQRIIDALVDLLRTGSQHPALIHEAVVALILSANQTIQLMSRCHRRCAPRAPRRWIWSRCTAEGSFGRDRCSAGDTAERRGVVVAAIGTDGVA